MLPNLGQEVMSDKLTSWKTFNSWVETLVMVLYSKAASLNVTRFVNGDHIPHFPKILNFFDGFHKQQNTNSFQAVS